ncbi:MAG: glycosyltransferase family 2 protein [Chloroflexi bacterium]|nr:glycosyltransferase family 2 protein [Chloroflexota bacterium]
MELSVIVVSFNTRELLASCIETVGERIGARSHQIVVVDNASSDGSAEHVAARFPNVVLVRNAENRGFAAAVNQGIEASTGRYLLLLNSDATLEPDAVERMCQHLDEHSNVAAVGGTLLNPDGSFQGSYADFPTLYSEVLLLSGLSRWLLPPTFPSHTEAESQQARPVDWVCGAFVLLRRAAVEQIGGLDEAYFMYAEEVDWFFRARQAGWTTSYLPEARAVHLVAGSYRRDATRRREQIYRSKWLYFRKNHGTLQSAVFLGLVRSLSLLKLLAWAGASAVAGPPARERARNNVASYRYLLSHI